MATIPVGTVFASLLELPDFAKAVGDPPTYSITGSKWSLADGTTCRGTDYAKVTGETTLPDLRGMFLRGKNGYKGDQRTDGYENPDNTALGHFQDDQFQEHAHDLNRGDNNGPDQGAFALPAHHNAGIPREPTAFVISGKSGTETRPRNVTVYCYIRINQ